MNEMNGWMDYKYRYTYGTIHVLPYVMCIWMGDIIIVLLLFMLIGSYLSIRYILCYIHTYIHADKLWPTTGHIQ